MEYYSSDQKSEVMKFGDKWIALETIILSEVAETQMTNIACFLSHVDVSSKTVDVFHSE